MKVLVLIPARGGSKGIPQKNIKDFCGKPLICYSIDIARRLVSDEDICVSTDDSEIISIVERYGLSVPFIRPAELSTDEAKTNDVILHALNFYEVELKKKYDVILLFQPTSPLRSFESVSSSLKIYDPNLDMVASVRKSHSPSVLCIEDDNNCLELVFNKNMTGRQGLKNYYEYNGAIYIINVNSIIEKGMSKFTKIKKYLMSDYESVDIDTPLDWKIAESIFLDLKKDANNA